MANYMAELALTGKPVLMFGGGRVARRKLAGLLEAGARVTVVAPRLDPWVEVCRENEEIRHENTEYTPQRLGRAPRPWLVFALTDRPELNREIARACAKRGLLCNSADDPAVNGFFVPAVVRRGSITVGVSTGGASPALSRLIKERIDAWLEEGWGDLAALFAKLREVVQHRLDPVEARQRFWRETCLAAQSEQRYLMEDNTDWLLARVEEALRNAPRQPGQDNTGGG